MALTVINEVTRWLRQLSCRPEERAAAQPDGLRLHADPDRGPPAGRADGPVRAASRVMLEVRELSKSFGGLKAIDQASLDVRQGEIVGLIGPNGAGKTTLFAAIAGLHQARRRPGRPRSTRTSTGLAPHRICAAGMVRTFQITQPFAKISVRENIMVGAYLHTADRRPAAHEAEAVAGTVGMADQLDQMGADLTVAGRKRLELARALATGPRLLLLDEVMAGLNPTEIGEIIPRHPRHSRRAASPSC